MGFERAESMFNRGHWKKIADSPMGDVQPTVYPYNVIGDQDTYTTDWLTSKAIGFVTAHCDTPFCYMVSFPDPHGPVHVRPPYDTLYDPAEMGLPETFDQDNLPDWARALQEESPFGIGKPGREEKLRRFLALYFGEVKLIDDCVGRILSALEDLRVLDETIVVFTTDHGEYAGEHGLDGKNHLYETAYRIPMLMRWPARIRGGTRVESIVSTVDFQPTILSLMEIPACGREQGHDGVRLLEGDRSDWQDCALLHHSSHECAGIFTLEFELAFVKGRDAILLDRKNDPQQIRNLFSEPSYRGVIRSLTRKIVDHHVSLDSPAAGWLKEM